MSQAANRKRSGTALVTGASSGIGYELSLLLARDGYDLVLVARNRAALEELAGRVEAEFAVRARVIVKDLSFPAAPEELYRELQRGGTHVDVLINDAGFALQGPFCKNDLTTLLDMLQVNVVTVTHLTRLLLPSMVERGRGRILNMASVGAFMPGPMMAAYFASKGYVLSLSEALANELRGTGVSVTALCPGPTRTRFALRAHLMETKAFRGPLLEPAYVAREGFNAMMKGKSVLITGFKHRMQMMPTPLVPRRLLAYFARRYHETRAPGHDAAKVWTATPENTQPSHVAQS
jgi:hypothetical protein